MERMIKLAREITIAIVREYDAEEFLKRLSDPYWFQAFGCVLGYDWHSSGLTTTACGALKAGLKDIGADIGIFVAGGKGKTSRKTPDEIELFGSRYYIKRKAKDLVYASRMAAKVDNNALQDGYTLYHHTFIFTKKGTWSVIQQGMNPETRWARRYHWLSSDLKDFVCEPHKAIACDHKGKPLNMVAQESEGARKASVSLACEKPQHLLTELKKVKTLNLSPYFTPLEIGCRRQPSDASGVLSLTGFTYQPRRLNETLERAHARKPKDFEGLLETKGVGGKTIRALALLSELIYGKKPSWRDPAKYSFAHGGKDGRPYPVDRIEYDRSIEILRSALSSAKVGRSEKLNAFKRLSSLI
jgi:hypothetical protein